MSSITSDADKYFVGIDVGTGSARAALVNAIGQVKSTHVVTIQTCNPKSDHYEQSSDDIWSAVCQCVKVYNHTTLLGGISFIFPSDGHQKHPERSHHWPRIRCHLLAGCPRFK